MDHTHGCCHEREIGIGHPILQILRVGATKRDQDHLGIARDEALGVVGEALQDLAILKAPGCCRGRYARGGLVRELCRHGTARCIVTRPSGGEGIENELGHEALPSGYVEIVRCR
jgi:hypothetical protein